VKISVFGTGYVGLVTGACLAQVGHSVLCADIDKDKVARLRDGHIPIWEPGLEDIVAENIANGNLSFTSDNAEAVAHGTVLFIAVGTPMGSEGQADLSYVMNVADSIAENLDEYRIVAVKSTVPVGTGDKVSARIREVLSRSARPHEAIFDVVSNPEFLKEGAAVEDFMKPDRILIGASSERAAATMSEVYGPFDLGRDKTIVTDIRSSELTKYAANAMLATKISFINEIANLAERLGADIEEVRKGMGTDPRIGPHFLNAGIGYGGSCFPKDVRALTHAARETGYEPHMLVAVDRVNASQKASIFAKIAKHFGGVDQLADKTIAVWGLSFKPNTDDMRDAPSRTVIEALWAAGAKVQAHDPIAMDEARRIYGDRADLELHKDKYSVLDGADALAICSEWQQFRAPDIEEMGRRMVRRVLFDGRNMLPPERFASEGWTYVGVGRGRSTETTVGLSSI